MGSVHNVYFNVTRSNKTAAIYNRKWQNKLILIFYHFIFYSKAKTFKLKNKRVLGFTLFKCENCQMYF